MSGPERSLTDFHAGGGLHGEPLQGDRTEEFRSALVAAGLPGSDIAEPGILRFQFARDRKAVGYGGLEVYGADALLRSIVVAADVRGEGVGRMIVEWLLARAGGAGARCAFLFATDSKAYFEGLGFEVVDRSRAPRSILTTTQAEWLCPASAALLSCAVTLCSGKAEPDNRGQEP